MKGALARARELLNRMGKQGDRSFLEAAMAVSALVSMADREVRLSEQLGLDYVLENAKRLETADPHEAVETHRRYVEEIRADEVGGRQAALAVISRFREDPESARLLLSVGLAIAKADSEISSVEDSMLGKISDALQLPHDESFLWKHRGETG